MQQHPYPTAYSLTGPCSQHQAIPKGAPARLLAVLVLGGCLELRADGSDFSIPEYGFIAVNASHSYAFTGPGLIRAMVLDATYTSFSAECLATLAMLRGRTVFLQHYRLDIMTRLMEIASLCIHEEKSGRREVFLSGILDLVISLAAGAFTASGGRQDVHGSGLAPAFLLLAGKSIRRHHTVAYYASALNVTPSHLNRVVKAALGLSAKSCLDSLLLSEAKLLLKDHGRNIAEVSDMLHFTHPAVFSRFFSRLAGDAPRRYRTDGQSTDR